MTTVYAPSSEPTVIQPTVTGPADGDVTVADATPTDSEAPAAPTVEDAPAPTTGGPQWDPARNAYIQWDPNQGTWLMYDDAAAEWKPIS